MNGILGSWDLLANINQAIYTNNYTGVNVVSVNLCNKNQSSVLVRIAVSTSTTAPTNAHWVVYDAEVGPRSAYEKTKIMLSPGQSIVVRASQGSVSAVCYGVTNASVAPGSIARNNGTSPTWVTTSPLTAFYAGDATTSVQLAATDAESEALTYSVTSGSLFTGLNLSSTGLITGTASITGYSAGLPDSTSTVTVSATDVRGNVTPRTFSIIKKWADGSSSANAAPNASIIKSLTGTTTNGTFWIDTGSGPVQTYCLMSTGVGYMLAAKIASSTNPLSQWSFYGTNWLSTSVLNEAAIANSTAGDAVGRAYYEYTLRNGMAMALGSVTNVITFTKTGVTPRIAFAGPTSTNLETQLTRSQFMSWIATAGTAASNWDNQPNSNRIRLNSLNEISNVGMRFGITMNNEADDNSNDSAMGFGTYTNNDYTATGVRNIPAGGHKWSPDQQFPYQGYIFVA